MAPNRQTSCIKLLVGWRAAPHRTKMAMSTHNLRKKWPSDNLTYVSYIQQSMFRIWCGLVCSLNFKADATLGDRFKNKRFFGEVVSKPVVKHIRLHWIVFCKTIVETFFFSSVFCQLTTISRTNLRFCNNSTSIILQLYGHTRRFCFSACFN